VEVLVLPEKNEFLVLEKRQHDGVFVVTFVNSSAISQVRHDPASLNLYVTFHGSRTYTYYGVPRTLYEALLEALLKAHSLGTFFNQHIRDKYSSAR
jgi:hypothetical protein